MHKYPHREDEEKQRREREKTRCEENSNEDKRGEAETLPQ
jgi:hypothetical protein